MAYIGRSVEYGNAASQQITGNNGATYTLTYDTTTDGVIISLDGVVQVNGTDFNIVGTALTFTSTVTTGVKVNVIYTGLTVAIGVPGDSTITTAKVADNAITSAKIVDGTILNADVNASAAIVTSKLSGAVTSIASHGLASSATTDTTNADNIGSGTLPDARLNSTMNPTLTSTGKALVLGF